MLNYKSGPKNETKRIKAKATVLKFLPDGSFKLTCVTKFQKKNCVTFMWYSNDTFSCMFKAKFATLISLKVPSENETKRTKTKVVKIFLPDGTFKLTSMTNSALNT